MLAGFLGFLVPKFLVGFHVAPFDRVLINFFDPFFIGLYLSLLFAAIGSALHPVTGEESEYRSRLLILPAAEKSQAQYRRDRVYGWVLIGAGLLTSIVLLLGWALPYNGLL